MSEFVQEVRKAQKQKHDTLYCNTNAKMQLLNTGNVNSSYVQADTLKVSGLEVVTHDRFQLPIVCEKSEVFDLAKDYKYNNEEPDDI